MLLCEKVYSEYKKGYKLEVVADRFGLDIKQAKSFLKTAKVLEDKAKRRPSLSR